MLYNIGIGIHTGQGQQSGRGSGKKQRGWKEAQRKGRGEWVVAPRPCQQGGCARRRVVSIDSGRLTHRIRGFHGRWTRTPSGHTGGLGYCGGSATGRQAGASWGLEEIGTMNTDTLSDMRGSEKLRRRPEGAARTRQSGIGPGHHLLPHPRSPGSEPGCVQPEFGLGTCRLVCPRSCRSGSQIQLAAAQLV